jgi:uncharacterized protein (DUF433 family)
MATIAYPHIEIKDGMPTIDGTRMKVVHLILEHQAGCSPEQMQEAHPFLTMAQIHSALAYYHDNREEIDRDIERRHRLDAEIARQVENSPVQKKLRQIIKNGRQP